MWLIQYDRVGNFQLWRAMRIGNTVRQKVQGVLQASTPWRNLRKPRYACVYAKRRSLGKSPALKAALPPWPRVACDTQVLRLPLTLT